MKKFLLFISIVLVISLCACGSKPQPTPTAAPTDVPTEIPTEIPTEVPTEVPTAVPAEPETAEEAQDENAESDAVSEEEEIPEGYDPTSAGSVLNYYEANSDESIFGSYAFMQLNTEGKKVWAAPLAGIQEFKVPETFLNAKGGIRASGGEETFPGKGIVSMTVLYLPITEADYDAYLDRLFTFAKEHEDPTEEDRNTYMAMIEEYGKNAYTLFEVYGIGENGTVEDLKNGIKENYMKLGVTEDEVDEYLNGLEIIEAGSAEDYRFYLFKGDRKSETFKESQAEYKEEYDALYDAIDTYPANFTFMHPLALAELVAEGTGLVFETKDLDGNTVSSAELFSGKKATMLNIWETTCSACMSEMPELNNLAEVFQAKGGQIVGLVLDATDEEMIAEAQDIAGDLELKFVNLLPTQELDDFFKIQAFPTTYFFNEKGEVIGEPIMGAAPDLFVTRMNELLADQ